MFIKKNFGYSSLDNEKQNSFFAYENMEMYINAQESNTWYTENQGVDLCFRLGKDDNYYEIRKPFKDDLNISLGMVSDVSKDALSMF